MWSRGSRPHGLQQQQLQDEYVPRERAGSRRQDQKTTDEKRAESTRCLFEVLELKRSKSTTEFWTVLATLNELGLI